MSNHLRPALPGPSRNDSPSPSSSHVYRPVQSYDYYSDSLPPSSATPLTPLYGSVAAVAGSGTTTPQYSVTPLHSITPSITPQPSGGGVGGNNNTNNNVNNVNNNVNNANTANNTNNINNANNTTNNSTTLGLPLLYDQESFSRSREMAQSDPDYLRRSAATPDNKELFHPLPNRKKPASPQHLSHIPAPQQQRFKYAQRKPAPPFAKAKPVLLKNNINTTNNNTNTTTTNNNNNNTNNTTTNNTTTNNTTTNNNNNTITTNTVNTTTPVTTSTTPTPVSLELLQKQAEANRSTRRHYNEGYKDRIKSLDNTNNSFGMPLGRNQTINELQRIFMEIASLEPKCQAALDPTFDPMALKRGALDDNNNNNNGTTTTDHPLESYTEDQWNAIAQEQIRLVELYCDFLYYASASIDDGEPHNNNHLPDDPPVSSYSATSTSSKSLQNLVRKYKIPTRLWNLGISLFIDSLRDTKPQFTNVLGRFIIHCMSLLMLFVDPIYETRHVWIESLGDLAFVCLISDVKFCADWPSMCTYWYQQRLLLTPGTGRVYRHMASISDIKIDKLFYICKSFTTWQPSTADAKEVLQMLNFSKERIVPVGEPMVTGGPYYPSSHLVPQSIYVFCTLHLQCIGVLDFRKFHVGSEIKKAILACNDPIIDHGATIALCNIAALLGHGAPDHPLFAMFQAAYRRKRNRTSHTTSTSTSTTTTTTSDEDSDLPYDAAYWAAADKGTSTDHIIQIAMPRLLAYDILYTFMSASEWAIGLQHVLVWLYFFISLCESFPEVQATYFSRFNATLFAQYLNRIAAAVANREYYDNSKLNAPEYYTPTSIAYDTRPPIPATSPPTADTTTSHKRAASPSGAPKKIDRLGSALAVFPEDELADAIRRQQELARLRDDPTAPVLAVQTPVPLAERPLPEEYHVRGFVWSAGLSRYAWLNCADMAVPDEPYVAAAGPKYLAEIRAKRVVALGRDLAKVAAWLGYDEEQGRFVAVEMAS